MLNTLSFDKIATKMLLLSPWIVEAIVKLLMDIVSDYCYILDFNPKLF